MSFFYDSVNMKAKQKKIMEYSEVCHRTTLVVLYFFFFISVKVLVVQDVAIFFFRPLLLDFPNKKGQK